jgi:UDP-glucose 4-epimerase
MTSEKWLITGGAGYIGAHVADLFLKDGKKIFVIDSLLKGMQSRIKYLSEKHSQFIPLETIDICDAAQIENVILNNDFTGIVHLAALKSVNESVEQPNEYKKVNHAATKEILKLAQKYGITKFIFSSTAAVYGEPNTTESCKESDQLLPISPYGSTKMDAEKRVTEFVKTSGNSGTSFRFFNVVGTASQELLDNSIENLVPIVLKKLSENEAPVVFGTNYPTKDGTCVRDFVDVRDIAAAHLLAANSTKLLPPVMNLGTGKATSVREVIEMILKVKQVKDSPIIESPRRAGDAAFVYANVSLAHKELGFKSKYSLEESIRSLF